MNQEFGPWATSICSKEGCLWIQEEDFMRDGRWLYHRGLSGLEVSAEDRLFIPGEMFKWDFGKAQLAALTFFDAHHLPPANIDDFDEERERARLVAV